MAIAAGLALLVFGSIFLTNKVQFADMTQSKKDEVTGTWHAQGVTQKDNYAWFVDYTFKNGRYDMKTDSAVKDTGTYSIVKRFEDGSIQMSKTSETFSKTYDIYITIDPNKSFIMIDGMKLYKK